MAIEDAGKEKARLETIVKNQLGSMMLPIEVKYTTDITINSHVLVTWEWADGHGPPTTGGGGGGGGGGGTPARLNRPRSAARRQRATADRRHRRPRPRSQPRSPPSSASVGRLFRRARLDGSTVKPTPDKPKKAEAAKPAGGGIAAMPTTTPPTAAQRATEERHAENTARHQAEAGEQLAIAASEWRDVTRQTFMRNLRKVISGPAAAPGHAAEPWRARPASRPSTRARPSPPAPSAYTTASGARHRLMRSRTPRTFEGTTHGERPTEGRVVQSYRRDPNDPRRGLADARTMSWFDPDEGFVDPEVRAQGEKLFNEAMGAREKEVYEQLKGVVEQRQGETQQEFPQRLMRDWTQAGWGFNTGKTFTTKAATLEGISGALQQSPAMEAMDKLRVEGKFGEFFGDEATPGALQLRAAQQSLIRARKVAEEEAKAEAKGVVFTEQVRKAALSKGTQRATNLRGGNGLPDRTAKRRRCTST